jgi:fluoride exporter
MLETLYIAVFGLIGVFSRYYLGLYITKLLPPPFPYGTFIINSLGSFIIGIIYVLGVEKSLIPADIRVGIMVGFLGGFTTFSSYCLETARLTNESKYFYAMLYLVLSPCVGYLAALIGIFMTRSLVTGPSDTSTDNG